jgi:hypothetical protein
MAIRSRFGSEMERGYGSGILFPGFTSGSLNGTEISAREGVKVVGNSLWNFMVSRVKVLVI